MVVIKGKRLDAAVLEMGAERSRERAAELIRSGFVFVDGIAAKKPGREITAGEKIEIRGRLKYVGRGGFKLEKAVKTFKIDLNGKMCMDIGASTGGFTDCMLQNGASRVYAVDVGEGQLAGVLRDDPRVINFEKTDIRALSSEELNGKADFFSADVSFVSLRLVLPHAKKFLRPGGEAVCLVKPQFEAGRDAVGKNGVVRSPEAHRRVLKELCVFACGAGYTVSGVDFSPIKGRQGNIEYLLYLTVPEDGGQNSAQAAGLAEALCAVVEKAFLAFSARRQKSGSSSK